MSDPRNGSNSGSTAPNPGAVMDVQEANAKYLLPAEQQVSKGYKQTEVGVIPGDWDVEPFSVVTNLITCGIAATPNYVSESNGYPFLSSGNVKNGVIVWRDYKHIDASLHRQLYRNNPPQRGDILYSRVGTIGEAAVIEVDFEFSVYVSLTLIKPKAILDSYFLMHLLNSLPYKQRAKDQVYLGGGVGNLNVDVVRRYPIIVPPLSEQEAIAEALSDADALIEALEQLVAKKRQLKQGAMQELLTGRRRLPGFEVQPGYKQTEVGLIPKDWSSVFLGTIFEISAGGDLDKGSFSKLEDDLFPYPIYANALTNMGLYGFSKYYQYEADKITVTARGDVGTAVYRNTNFNAIGRLLVLTPKQQCDLRFLAEYIDNFVEFAFESTGVPQLTAPQISKYQVALPGTETEQTAIAQILTDMDAEITELDTKLTKARAVKQGMMQQLLTGKVRLV